MSFNLKKYIRHLAVLFAVLFGVWTAFVILLPLYVVRLDSFVHALVLPLQTEKWTPLFLLITHFGDAIFIILAIVLVTALFRHRPDIIARLLIAILGSTITGSYLKDLIHRARPVPLSWLAAEHSYSYPSGHATSSSVLYGFLALLLYVHSNTKTRKTLAVLIPVVLVILIGISRIVLDYHYVSDVIGGILIGTFWVTFALALPLYHDLYHENAIHSEPIERPLL